MVLLEMLPQMLIDGLQLGFVYAIVALGYTMVYGALSFINFANAEVFMCGSFIGAEILIILLGDAISGPVAVVSFVIATVISMLLTGLLGVVIERVAYRPLRQAPRLVPLISAFGVSYFLQDLVRIIETFLHNSFYLTVPSLFKYEIALTPSASLTIRAIMIISVCLMSLVVLSMFINKTKIGSAIRCVSQNQMVSSLLGVDVNKTITITFFVGAAMGGIAGSMFAIQYGMINPYIGNTIGIKSFTAAVLGGIGNIPGSMLGGVLLGLAEALAAGYLNVLTGGVIGSGYKDIFAFVMLILILIFKPNGLLGKAAPDKV